MPLTTQKINSQMHALMPILKRLKTLFLKSQNKIRNLCDYILNMSKKKTNAIKIYNN